MPAPHFFSTTRRMRGARFAPSRRRAMRFCLKDRAEFTWSARWNGSWLPTKGARTDVLLAILRKIVSTLFAVPAVSIFNFPHGDGEHDGAAAFDCAGAVVHR